MLISLDGQPCPNCGCLSFLLRADAQDAQPLVTPYTNYRGERRVRRLVPIAVYFGASPHHEGEQWFLRAFDLEKLAERDFALSGFAGPNLKETPHVP